MPIFTEGSGAPTTIPKTDSMVLGQSHVIQTLFHLGYKGARCSSMVRAFAHGAMGHRIDPSWSGPIDLFIVPASSPWLVCAMLSVGWCI